MICACESTPRRRSSIENLEQSPVGNAIGNKRTIERKLSDTDPLTRIAGQEGLYVYSVPILLPEHAARCVVFYKRKDFKGSDRRAILERLDHFELMIESITQSEAVDEISTAAFQGRLAIASMHELRGLLGPLLEPKDGSPDSKTTPENIQATLVELSESADRVREIVRGQLKDLRPVQKERTDLVQLIGRTVNLMKKYLDDLNKKRDVHFNFIVENTSTTPDQWETCVNPVIVERALSNLIENAYDFIDRCKVQKIWIRLQQIRNDRKFQFRITVEDTGPGVDAASRPMIFLPRRTEGCRWPTGV